MRPYHLSEPIKSVGNSTTYARNLTTREEVRSAIALLSDSVAMRLRRHGLYCAGVQVGIKDPQFKNISRQKQLGRSTHLMRDISAAAMELIDAAWKYPSPIRLLSVTAIHLTEAAETFEQHSLFETAAEAGSEKLEKIERTVDAIRGKFGAGLSDSVAARIPYRIRSQIDAVYQSCPETNAVPGSFLTVMTERSLRSSFIMLYTVDGVIPARTAKSLYFIFLSAQSR